MNREGKERVDVDACQHSELQIQRWSFPVGLLRGVARFWRVLCLCLQVQRERQLLRSLDERTLKDIGLSRVDALREGVRGFGDLEPARAEQRLPR